MTLTRPLYDLRILRQESATTIYVNPYTQFMVPMLQKKSKDMLQIASLYLFHGTIGIIVYLLPVVKGLKNKCML